MYGLNTLRPSIDGYASISRVTKEVAVGNTQLGTIQSGIGLRLGEVSVQYTTNTIIPDIDTSHLKNLVPHHCSSPSLLLSIDATTVPASPDR